MEKYDVLDHRAEHGPLYPYDMINSPKHYMLFEDMEAIDAIKALLTKEEFDGYLKGNELKYRFRAGMKDSVTTDIGKAMQYRQMREDYAG